MRKHFDAEDDSTALVVPEQAMRMMPCLWCRDATPVSVLNHLGGALLSVLRRVLPRATAGAACRRQADAGAAGVGALC